MKIHEAAEMLELLGQLLAQDGWYLPATQPPASEREVDDATWLLVNSMDERAVPDALRPYALARVKTAQAMLKQPGWASAWDEQIAGTEMLGLILIELWHQGGRQEWERFCRNQS